MAWPKITYDPGTGEVELPFTYPPVENAAIDENGADEYEAIRTDSITSTGLVQSVIERVDNFRTLNMKNVPIDDLPAWQAFMRHAILGKTFTYFDDADAPSGVLCTLVDPKWRPAYNFRTIKQFTLKLRLAATGQDAGEETGGGGPGPETIPPVTLEVTAPEADDFTVPHGLGANPVAVIPVATSPGLIRLQATGWDATNVYLNASAAGVTAVVYLFQ